jgi:hypothetical protein
MFRLEVYLDDSGTDGNTPIAVAACYISSKEQWDHFTRNWDDVREKEGFDVFHMCEFVAKKEAGHKPFCDWDNAKKNRVYSKLASIINTRVRRGFAIAVPKASFDRYVFQEFKDGYAADHYTWAVRSILCLIADWRQKLGIAEPMQFVFHRGSLGQDQINRIWQLEAKKNTALPELRFGIASEGVLFEDGAVFKPLQAADILAWQIQNHMRRTVMVGKPTYFRAGHEGLVTLLKGRPVDAMFYSTEQLRKVFDNAKLYKQEHGDWPWEKARFRESAVLGKAGTVDL